MTINSDVRVAGPFTATGAAQVLPFTFRIFNVNDVVLVVTDLAGADTTYTNQTGFTVAMNADQNTSPGGSVTVTSALNYKLTLTTALANTQPAQFANGGAFLATVVNDALDRLTVLIQQAVNAATRSLKLPISDGTSVSTLLPGAALRANKLLAFDGSGNAATSNLTLTQLESVTTTSQAAATTATTQADIATTQADIATTQADIATTQATAAASAVLSVANKWLFATSTTMADPSTGNVRLNNASPASVTAIAISALSGDTGNPNLRTFIAAWDDSTNTVRGTIRVEKDASNYAIYNVSGALTDNTTWLQLAVAYVTGAGSFSASDQLFISFSRAGDAGTNGATGGTTLAINTQTGTTYTAVLGDAGGLTTLNSASAITYTVPLNSSVAFPVGTQILLEQLGEGRVTVVGAGGVTLNKPSTRNAKARNQYSFLLLVKNATDTWTLGGDMESV